MKITTRLYYIILLSLLLCTSYSCSAEEPQVKDPLITMKHALIGDDSPPQAIVSQITDVNRDETVTKLKKILSESIASPDAKHSVEYAERGMLAYTAITKESPAAVKATLQPFVNYPNPEVQHLASWYIAKSGGDGSVLELLKSQLPQAESNLPYKSAFNAQTEKQYMPAFRTYFGLMLELNKIKTPEAVQLRDQSLARFKAKYEGTDFGPKLMDAYNEGLKRESQK